ncbi:unnamed protein product [Trichobilharzia regenti]|nr:unnamed protein product [Trichobilharzia regenti]
MSILDDKSKFSRDPSSEDIQLLQGTATANLLKLHGLSAISKDKFNSLKPSAYKFPHMCGLPKIHKPNNPLRSILSMGKSPTHKLSKWHLLLLCTNNVRFTFEGDCFRQVGSVAMASPLGPLLADIYMSHIENLSEDLIENVPLYRRWYVDDIVVISDHKPCSATSILNRMNEVQNRKHITYICL